MVMLGRALRSAASAYCWPGPGYSEAIPPMAACVGKDCDSIRHRRSSRSRFQRPCEGGAFCVAGLLTEAHVGLMPTQDRPFFHATAHLAAPFSTRDPSTNTVSLGRLPPLGAAPHRGSLGSLAGLCFPFFRCRRGRMRRIFFLFIHYSHATYGDHGENRYSPFSCPLSAQWRLVASTPLPSAHACPTKKGRHAQGN